MAQFPSFDEHFRPQIQNSLNQHLNSMERKVNEAQQSNDADEAEKMLDQACEECVKTVQSEVNRIKASIKDKRPSETSSQEQKDGYRVFLQAATAGFLQTQGLFAEIFSRLRNIVSTVVDWIRKGLGWIGSKIRDAFSAIRSLF